MPNVTEDKAKRIQRVLAYMMASMIGVSILALFALVFGNVIGLDAAGFASGAWPVILVLPLYALPFGFLCFIALIIVVAGTRAREAKAQELKAQAAKARTRPRSRQGK